KYYYEHKRRKKSNQKKVGDPGRQRVEKPTAIKSVRGKVIAYLNDNPDASIRTLCEAFPKANKRTIGNYRSQWRKKDEKQAADGRIKQQVFEYLDRNPEANLNELRKAFPDGDKKLVTIFRNWKYQQTQKRSNRKQDATPARKDVAAVKVDSENAVVRSLRDTIDRQKETIDKQKTRIVRMKSQLMNRPRFGLSDIKKTILEKIFKSK
ncbi:MAG: hypothetical protein GY866_00325, partial [Proteobacteria bacterium]|nr:hypothetical protein [Pseudomonadota bacterium]